MPDSSEPVGMVIAHGKWLFLDLQNKSLSLCDHFPPPQNSEEKECETGAGQYDLLFVFCFFMFFSKQFLNT